MYKFTYVSEVLAASVIRSMSTHGLHGATTQKKVIFILAVVRTLNHTLTLLGEEHK
jgi:hypothetical protein